MRKQNVINLLQLIQENPDLEIMPMVDSEIVCDDSHGYWAGSWGNAEIDEYWCSDERVYFRSLDEEELIDNMYDDLDEIEDDTEALKKAEEIVNGYDWKKAIIVYIQTP